MDYSLPEETRTRLDAMRALVDEHVVPLEPLFLEGNHEALMTALEARRQDVRERGWWAPNLPREAGGLGVELTELGLMSEVFGRSPLGHFSFGAQAPDA